MSVITQLQVNGANSITMSGLGTNLTFFPPAPGSAIGTPSSQNGYLYVPGNNEMNGRRMMIRASGTFQLGFNGTGSSVFSVGLYYANFNNTVATPNTTSPILLGTQNNIITHGSPRSWQLIVDLEGDNATGDVYSLSGTALVNLNPTSIIPTSVLTGINFNNSIPFGLLIGVQFGSLPTFSGFVNTASLSQFDLSD
ncbi:MAG: hypothetical protein WB780_10885 [Candidatus Acidiferrales bacterium]